MPSLEILLLAAGESKRMGQPKALLDWFGQSLLELQFKKLQALNLPISLVLGAYSKEILELSKPLEIETFVNPNWQDGMGASLAFGVQELLRNKPQTEAILLFLVDQPLLEISDLNRLLSCFQENSGKIIVSQSDEGWSGPPAIFPKSFFSALKNLSGDDGAKPVVKRNQASVLKLEMPNMADMDTPEAYQRLLAVASRQS